MEAGHRRSRLIAARLLTLGAALVVSGAAPAPPTADQPAALDKAAPRPTTVSGVTVVARLPKTLPTVASTFPAAGATVAPGVLVLRVTYDQRMLDGGWSYVTSAAGEYPDCDKTPRLLDDGKSFALICRTLPKKTYAVWFNHADHENFVGVGYRAATPYHLVFSTNDDDPIFTLEAAMKADPALPPGSNPAEPVGKRMREPPGAGGE